MTNGIAEIALQAAFSSSSQKAILCDTAGTIIAVSDPLVRHCSSIFQDMIGHQVVIESAQFDEYKLWHKNLTSHHHHTRLNGTVFVNNIGELNQLNIITIVPLKSENTLAGFKITLEDQSLFENSIPPLAWQQLFRESSEGMCIFDDRFSVVSANNAFKTITACPNPQQVKIFDLLRVQNDFKAWLLNSDDLNTEVTFPNNPAIALAFLSITAIDLGGRQVFWCILKDASYYEEKSTQQLNTNDRFTSFFNDNINGIAFVSKDHVFVEVNECFTNMLKMEPADIVGKHFSAFNAESSFELPEKEAATFVKNGYSKPFEKRLVRKDGREIRVIVQLFPHYNRQGEFIGAWNFIHEVDSSHDASINNPFYFETLFSDSHDAMLLTSANGEVRLANKAFAQFLNQTPEELVGKNISAITVPEDLTIERNLHFPLIKERGYSDQYEKRFLTPTGAEIPVSVRSTLVRNAQGKPDAIWTIARDASIQRKLIQSLAISERRFRALFSNSIDAIGFWTTNNEMQYANKAYLDLIGYSQVEMRDLTYHDFTPPGWEAADQEMAKQVEARGYSDIFEKEVLRKDGKRVPISIRASAMKDANGDVIGSWVIIRDISEHKETLRKLQHSQNMLEQTSHMSRVGGWELDTESSSFTLTAETYNILSIPRSYHTSVKNIAKLFDPKSEKKVFESVANVLKGRGSNTVELKLMGFSPERWIRVSAQLAFEEKGQRYAYGAVQDISDFKLQQKSLESARDNFQKMAFHDPLTNLPNRLLLEDRFQQITNQARRDKKMVALLIIDLDDFKAVNDKHGHPAGDALLVKIANRLSMSIRSSDTVARLGGDEFVVIAMLEDQQQAESLAEKILTNVCKEVKWKNTHLRVSCSLGISLSEAQKHSFEQLYALADETLYYIKEHGKDAFGFSNLNGQSESTSTIQDDTESA